LQHDDCSTGGEEIHHLVTIISIAPNFAVVLAASGAQYFLMDEFILEFSGGKSSGGIL
jgi:hypothetical protein